MSNLVAHLASTIRAATGAGSYAIHNFRAEPLCELLLDKPRVASLEGIRTI
jgi:hypothetical protein